jgi:hypothetical protein
MDRFRETRKIAKAALHVRETALQGRIAALQAEGFRRAEQDARPSRQVPEAVAALECRRTLSFRDDVLWLKEGEAEAGPLCPGCWGREHNAVLMQIGSGTWSCPVCHRAARMPALS